MVFLTVVALAASPATGRQPAEESPLYRELDGAMNNATAAIADATAALHETLNSTQNQVVSAGEAAQGNVSRERANAESTVNKNVWATVDLGAAAYNAVKDAWPKTPPGSGSTQGQAVDMVWEKGFREPPPMNPGDAATSVSPRADPSQMPPSPNALDPVIDAITDDSAGDPAIEERAPSFAMAESTPSGGDIVTSPQSSVAESGNQSWTTGEISPNSMPASPDTDSRPKALASSVLPFPALPSPRILLPIIAGTLAALLAVGTRPLLTLWTVLRRLLGGSSLVRLFSRRVGDEVLQHPGRDAVLRAILARPGLSISELVCEVGIGRSTLRHHLKVLIRENHIRVHANGKTRHPYPVGRGLAATDLVPLTCLTRLHRQEVARAIQDSPGCYQKEVAAAARLPSSRVHEYAGELVAAGLVREARAGRFRIYFPTEKLEVLLKTTEAKPAA